MSRRAADLRFLAPRDPADVALLGSATALAAAFSACGLPIVTRPGASADLVVTDVRHRHEALHAATGTVIVVGRPPLAAAQPPAGWHATAYLRRQGAAGPTLLATATPRVRRFLGREWSAATGLAGRLRAAVVAGPLAPLACDVVVLSRDGGPPATLAAAVAAGAPRCDEWFLTLPGDSDHNRLVAFAFAADHPDPAWVLKVNREPDLGHRGEREAAALTYLAGLGPSVAARVPRTLAMVDVGRTHATAETPARGRTLTRYLPGAEPGPALALVEDVVAWSCALTAATVTPGPPGPPASPDLDGVDGAGALLARVAGVPRVFAHGDLGASNVMTDGTGFTVIDWEDSGPDGLPVWDVALLGTDALLNLRGLATRRADWVCRLWRGDLPDSPLLFRWLGQAAQAAGVGPDTAAALVTHGWVSRPPADGDLGGDDDGEHDYASLVRPRWLADPRLGIGWRGPGTA